VRLTVRTRLTALYGLLVFVAGVVLMVVVYLLVGNNLVDQLATAVSGKAVIFGDPIEAVPARTVPYDVTVTPGQIAEVSSQTVLGKLLVVSAVSLPVLAVLAVAVGWWVSGRVLMPLHQISATARRLCSDNLHERIALAGPPDELTELAGTFDDMLARLEAAFESQRRFIANASHELRTPLAIQRAAVQIGLADADPDVVAKLLAATRRSERLIDGLLLLARSDRGLEHREPVALHTVVAEQLAEQADAVEARRLTVTEQLTPCEVLGDPMLLRQLVGNLVGNAVRHNVDGGELRVRTDPARGLVVSNSGPPVAPDQVAELFEPFRRGGGRTADEGAGLGLSIVRSIVQAHGGAVHAKARRDGGLTVRVELT
jgi:signal transduction histidine kinase